MTLPFRPGGRAARLTPEMIFLRPALPCALLMLAWTAVSCAGDREPFIDETFAMGTKAMVTIYGLEDGEAAAAAAEALGEIHRIESVISNWREDSELSRLNRRSGDGPVRISPELHGLLERSAGYCEASGGAFDVTALPLVRLWGFRGGEPSVPRRTALDEALGRVGCGRFRLDAGDTTAALDAGVEIDLAGVGKGYAVDMCAKALIERGVTSGLVNLGGNMYAIGAPPGRRGWTIGIRDPGGSAGVVGELVLSDAAVSTSGNYENFVVIGGERYGHIIDPRTGKTVDSVLSVTVIAESAEEADALSTGLFVTGPEGAADLRGAFPGLKALFAMEDDAWEMLGDLSGMLEIP